MSCSKCYSRHQLDIGRQCLWEQCGKIYMKNYAPLRSLNGLRTSETNRNIKDFHPTITKDLLTKCLKFPEEKVQISNDDEKIIYHARKSLLFNEGGTWMKKDRLFDVTVGAYDGAEACELVGTFLLYKISEKYDKNSIGLYRDDGLSLFKNKSGNQLERIKKKLQKTFKDFGLEIVAESNLRIVNDLDVTLNLNNASFKPYYKPDGIIQYINKESNHPLSIIKRHLLKNGFQTILPMKKYLKKQLFIMKIH